MCKDFPDWNERPIYLIEKENIEIKTQLAEALGLLRSAERQLLSFHREHESQWCGYLDDALGAIKYIIARHVQAGADE